jgi:transposase InsO family protein
MQVHANAKLGPAGRVALVELIASGVSLRAAAAALNVAPATAHRWWHRYLDAGVAQANQASLDWARDRSSRPHRSPRQLTAEQERPILEARRRTRFGPARLAGLLRIARSTIWKVLRRHGLSRLHRSTGRQTYRRYEWSQPGALLHLDTMKLPKFDRPGHWSHGDRRRRSRRVGSVYIVSVLDDHSRLAYSELHSGETAITVTATLRRAAAWMREQGCGPVEAVMTDNHKAHTSHLFQALLGELGARHILTPAYTPRWNGKLERFNKTLDQEWARVREWPNSTKRDRSLRSFLRYYNRRRPHTSLGDRPPISRVHNLCGQDS